MKKIWALLIIVSGCQLAFAQKPLANDNQLSGGFTPGDGTNTFLLFRHYKKDYSAWRYGLGWSYQYTKNGNTYLVPGTENTSSGSSGNFSASIGLQKSINTTFNKLEPYVALDIVLSNSYSVYHSKSVITDTSLLNYNNGYNYNGDYTTTVTKNPTSLGLGIRPVIGANYYFNSNWGLGIEYRINSFLNSSYSFGEKDNQEQVLRGVFSESTTTGPKSFYLTSSFSGSLYVTMSYKFNKL